MILPALPLLFAPPLLVATPAPAQAPAADTMRRRARRAARGVRGLEQPPAARRRRRPAQRAGAGDRTRGRPVAASAGARPAGRALGKPPASDAAAGLAMFQVARPGTYRIALGTPAWIDVVRAGQPLAAMAHGHGPACSGIRKIVDFRLRPGRYVLQVSGGGTSPVPIMIVHAAGTGGQA
ncbi:hypothetical protein AB5I41_31865 [Sphingomonas sp. MMS24-JH45]